MAENLVPSLELIGINKEFPGVKALTDVSLKAFPGSVHALIGENGAGKSTLMNVIMGIHQPNSGIIKRLGREIVVSGPLEAQRIGIGMVPQELTLVPQLTVAENICLGALSRGLFGASVNWRATFEKARNALAMVGAPEIDAYARIDSLGAAQQQLVQIAKAMANKAEVLILDEPTASLTHKESERLFDLILEFKAAGGLAFYISHRLEEIKRLCDTTTVLRDGRHIVTARTGEMSVDEMIRNMVGRSVVSGAIAKEKLNAEGGELLRVNGLSRRGEFENASFSLSRGEILGFSGLVGSGRTELMKCVVGDTQADSGTIHIGASEVEKRFSHPAESISCGMAYLPEERRAQGIFPVLSVAENLALPSLARFFRWYWGIDSKRRDESVDEYIQKLNVRTPTHRQLIRNLSGGNQQKVILARWLLKGCRILILDEPTRGIDVNAKKEIHELLTAIARKDNVSIILVSSEMQELLDVCDRIVVMHLGRIKGEVKITPDVNQEAIMRIALS